MSVLKDLTLRIHQFHSTAYSFYKIRESKLSFSENLIHSERECVLKFRPALTGENLIVYDIGASTGISCSSFAKLRNVSRVYSFEPVPSQFDKLSARMKSYDKVNCYNIALGDQNGVLPMYVSRWTDSSSLMKMTDYFQDQIKGVDCLEKIDVKTYRLDDYFDEAGLLAADFIKIDVQGFEKKVIAGGEKTIRKAKYCALEMSFQVLYEDSPLFDEMYRTMYDIGFRLISLSTPMVSASGTALQVDGIFENISVRQS
jgi:FkbM family methyltransferase